MNETISLMPRISCGNSFQRDGPLKKKDLLAKSVWTSGNSYADECLVSWSCISDLVINLFAIYSGTKPLMHLNIKRFVR